MSAVYAKYVSTPIHPVDFPQKNQFPNKPGFPLFKLIILDWYPYVSLFPDLLCNIASSVSGLRKIRFNAHTPRRFSTKKSVPKQTRIPVVHVNNSRLVSLRFSIVDSPDLLCNIALSVSGLRKIRFNAYTPRRFSTKKSVPKQTRIPVVHVNNSRSVSLRFSVP